MKSKLGYLLSGPLPVANERSSATASCMLNVTTAPPSVTDLERIWKLESMGIPEEECDTSTCSILTSYTEENCITYKDGRHIAKLPWKEDHPVLPTNYNICKRRTENTIKRLSAEPDLQTKYGQIIEDQLKRGFIERCETDVTPAHPVHYIPHHPTSRRNQTPHLSVSCMTAAVSHVISLLLATSPELNDFDWNSTCQIRNSIQILTYQEVNIKIYGPEGVVGGYHIQRVHGFGYLPIL